MIPQLPRVSPQFPLVPSLDIKQPLDVSFVEKVFGFITDFAGFNGIETSVVVCIFHSRYVTDTPPIVVGTVIAT